MRTIKFRAWDGKKMWTVETMDELQSKELQVMQFTGLLDKNGKEIYEGDIMSVNGEVAKVFYDENNVCFCLDTDVDYNPCIGRYEIIGNIYEHSHLLSTK